MAPNYFINLWLGLDYQIGSHIQIISIRGAAKHKALEVSWLMFWKFLTKISSLNPSSVPNWAFLGSGIEINMYQEKILLSLTIWTHYEKVRNSFSISGP